MQTSTTGTKAAFRRARISGVLWCCGLLGLLYAYWFVMANFVIRNFWDPPYALKLDALRACVARYPRHPLWLVMGSSRVMVGFRPDVLENNLREKDAPLLFNFGMGGVGLPRQYIYFRRLLKDGFRPQRVGIEIFAADLSREIFTPEEGPYLAVRARRNEFDDYLRYTATPPDFTGIWMRARWDP